MSIKKKRRGETKRRKTKEDFITRDAVMWLNKELIAKQQAFESDTRERFRALEKRFFSEPLGVRVVLSGMGKLDRLAGDLTSSSVVPPRFFFGKANQIQRLGTTTLHIQVWSTLTNLRLEVPTADCLIVDVKIGGRSLGNGYGLKSMDLEGEIAVHEIMQVTVLHEPASQVSP